MNMKGILTAACLLLSILCAPSWAQHAIKISSVDRAALEALEVDPAWMRDYGGYLWLEGNDDLADAVARLGVPFEPATTAGVLRVHDEAADPVGERADFGAAPRSTDGYFLSLVQFRGPVLAEDLAALRAAGHQPLQYYPNHAYLVWSDAPGIDTARSLPQVRWAGDFGAAVRVRPALARMAGLIRNVNVHFYNDGRRDDVLQALQAAGAQVLDHWPAQPDGRLWDAKIEVHSGRLDALAAIPQVISLTYLSPEPGLDDESGSQTLAGNLDANNVPVPGYMDWLDDIELDGTGVTWSVTDTGVWYGHGDYNDRIVGGFTYSCPSAPNPGDEPVSGGGHGTHVAGVIAGNGAGGFTDNLGHLYGMGMAPGSSIFAQNPLCGGPWPPTGGWEVLSRNALEGGAIGSNNSWHTGQTPNGYESPERTHDIMVLDGNFDSPDYEPFIFVFSAGNSGPGTSTLTKPKEAKNIIVTGGTQTHRVSGNVDAMYNFSSRGPAADGRTLPTIAAPAQSVSSATKPSAAQCAPAIGGTSGLYSFCSGTSMAAPHASGSVVLMAEWWRDNNGGEDFSPAMAKALLVNSATAISGASAPPNNDVGWGRIDLRPVLDSDLLFDFVDQEVLFENSGEEWSVHFVVDNPAEPLKVSLVWSDAPGAVGANPALVNDLDLEVQMGGETYLGNVLSGGWSVPGGMPDRLNNLESVFVETPASFGAITVRAHQIAGSVLVNDPGVDTAQHFALVCQNCAFGGVAIEPPAAAVCAADGSVDFALTLSGQFEGSTDLSSSGEPAGTGGSFSPNPVIFPDDQSIYTVSGLANAASGDYTLVVTATDDGDATNAATSEVNLTVYEDVSDPVDLQTPADGATGVEFQPEFTWDGAMAPAYRLQVATDPAFDQIVIDVILDAASFTPEAELASGTDYYWRVRAINACGESAGGDVFGFQTRFQPLADTAPEAFAFEVSQNRTDSDTLEIANVGTGNLEWSLTTNQDACTEDPVQVPWLSADPEAGGTPAEQTDEVTVTVDTAGMQPGPYAANLCLATNAEGQALIAIAVELTVTPRPPGELEVDLQSLDFGGVGTGGQALLAVTVSNVAVEDALDLELTQIEVIVGAPEFEVADSDCGAALAAQDSCTVQVRFAPAALVSYSGILRIDAAGHPAVNVGLSGSGEEPVEPVPLIFEDRFEVE